LSDKKAIYHHAIYAVFTVLIHTRVGKVAKGVKVFKRPPGMKSRPARAEKQLPANRDPIPFPGKDARTG